MKSGLALAALFAIAIATPAQANVAITGSGTWTGDANFTRYDDINKLGDSWSFSFELPDVTSSDTTEITNAEFDRNGAPINETLDEVVFHDSADGGFFDLMFDDGYILTFFGDSAAVDIGSTGTIAVGGPYDVIPSLDGFNDFGTGTVSVARVGTAPTPEPATLALLGAGLAGFAGLRRRKPAA